MIYPEFPKEGSVIGICAPSAGVGGKLESFDMSLEALHESGFETYETASVRSDDYPSAPADVRGAEFNQMFADDDIDLVLCASGGDFCSEILPFVDQKLLKKKPKWFSGYSDPTAIELLMTTKLDIATIYGCNGGAWDLRPLLDYQQKSLYVLHGDIPVQHSYEMWASQGFNEEAGQYLMDAPVTWSLFKSPEGSAELEEASSLDVSGRMIGGCIDVIDDLIGTPYEDLLGFAKKYRKDGLIWYFDNFALDPLELTYSMLKMKLMGLFENAKAVIFGRTCFPGEASDYDYLSQLERVFAGMDVPVIWGADIGHTKPSFTIINGAIGHLICDNGRAELRMELK